MIESGVNMMWGNPIWRTNTDRQLLQNSVYMGSGVRLERRLSAGSKLARMGGGGRHLRALRVI